MSADVGLAGLDPEEAAKGALFWEEFQNMPDPLGDPRSVLRVSLNHSTVHLLNVVRSESRYTVQYSTLLHVDSVESRCLNVQYSTLTTCRQCRESLLNVKYSVCIYLKYLNCFVET